MKRAKLPGPAQAAGEREQEGRAGHCQRRRCNVEAEGHGTVEVSSRLAAAEMIHRQEQRGSARAALRAGITREQQQPPPFLLAPTVPSGDTRSIWCSACTPSRMPTEPGVLSQKNNRGGQGRELVTALPQKPSEIPSQWEKEQGNALHTPISHSTGMCTSPHQNPLRVWALILE